MPKKRRTNEVPAGAACWICGRPATAMDHVKPRAKGGDNSCRNLKPICTICNSTKGSDWAGYGPEAIAALKERVLRGAEASQSRKYAYLLRLDLLGLTFAPEAGRLMANLGAYFPLARRRSLRLSVLRELGGSDGAAKLRAAKYPEGGVVHLTDSGIVTTFGQAHTDTFRRGYGNWKRRVAALKRAGIKRPEACERCGTRSTIRPDGGRTALYKLFLNSDVERPSVQFLCGGCYRIAREARRG